MRIIIIYTYTYNNKKVRTKVLTNYVFSINYDIGIVESFIVRIINLMKRLTDSVQLVKP